MEEELKIIACKMNEFSKKYDLKIDVETFESVTINNDDGEIVYRLKAVRPEKTLAEIFS